MRKNSLVALSLSALGRGVAGAHSVVFENGSAGRRAVVTCSGNA
ncbi:hypothetical protein [Dactylosporangium roseum]|nr:hypothetical protein [Dactylosporangium roseum]